MALVGVAMFKVWVIFHSGATMTLEVSFKDFENFQAFASSFEVRRKNDNSLMITRNFVLDAKQVCAMRELKARE